MMANIVLTLGGVDLRSFEIPAALAVTARQRLAVHRLLSGAQIVDVLGPDRELIEWRGALSGQNASSRACEFDRMRQAGSPLTLTWDVYTYSVLISEFNPDYQNQYWIPYSISCLILRDLSAPVAAVEIAALQSITNDLGSASSYANVSAFLGAVSAGDLVPGSAAYATAIAAGTALQAALQSQLISAGSALSGSFNSSLVACASLAATAHAGGYVSRAMTNLTNLEP